MREFICCSTVGTCTSAFTLGSQGCCSQGGVEGRALQARILLCPLSGLSDFRRIGGRYENLRQQRIGIKRDGRGERVELFGALRGLRPAFGGSNDGNGDDQEQLTQERAD